MNHVRVEPAGVEIEIRPGETLLDAAWREGYRWPTTCFGQARCTCCHVVVKAGDQNVLPISDSDERATVARLSRLLYRGDARGLRLACRMSVAGHAVVEQHDFRGERRSDLELPHP